MLEITPKVRPNFKFSYDGEVYELPGIAPQAIITATDGVPKPKVYAGAQKDAYDKMTSQALINVFLTEVLPESLTSRPSWDAYEHTGEIFSAWSEYVELGKSKSSDA
ncbi:hypothetical protein M2390_000499 [Mycetocola sp. BIGb0189]|uniref:hypothetical protein n=1 Tax=Mycetocola sp. BIGb0189 TaxID=2940604 RepID=UPI002167EB84|nr:hypothetical protein [Mycetocola sp. BIGb0189]MCS4275338.1 hypothetical protein [Mycetocola sp. BIGb0189]